VVQCGDCEDKGDIKFGKVECYVWFHHSCVAYNPSDFSSNRVFICSACTERALFNATVDGKENLRSRWYSKKYPSRLEEEIVFSEELIPKKIDPLVPRSKFQFSQQYLMLFGSSKIQEILNI
jgi:hypothetical protein